MAAISSNEQIDMPLSDVMFGWTPSGRDGFATAGQIVVAVHPDRARTTIGFLKTDGACFGHWRRFSNRERLLRLFHLFNQIVVRDRLDPQTVHQAFLQIPEYRRAIPLSQEGADERPAEFGDHAFSVRDDEE